MSSVSGHLSLIDTHCQIHYEDFDADRAEVIQRAQDAGVKWLFDVGTSLPDTRISLEYTRKYDFIFGTGGIHPHEAKDATDEMIAEIETILTNEKKMVAVGECGLDFFKNYSPQDVQIDVFEKFLDVYDRVKKPLILHSRDSYSEMYEILKSRGSHFDGILHVFSEDKEWMFKYLDLGLHISFAGPLTYKKNKDLREACAACPVDRLFVETDSPFLPSQRKRGKRNEPAFIMETAECAAKLVDMHLEDFCHQVTKNAENLFNIQLTAQNSQPTTHL